MVRNRDMDGPGVTHAQRSNAPGHYPLYLKAMSVARSVTHFVALVSLAAGLAGCGEVVGYPAAVRPAVLRNSRRAKRHPQSRSRWAAANSNLSMRLHQLYRSLCRPGAMVGRNLQVAESVNCCKIANALTDNGTRATWPRSRQSGHNPNFRVLSGRRSLARNTDSWGFLFGLVNERLWRKCTHRDPPISDGLKPGARGHLGCPRQC